MSDSVRSLVWFRNNLRIADNPPLFEALKHGPVLPLFILDPKENLGAASQCWLYRSLHDLNTSLKNHLCFYKGDTATILKTIAKRNNIHRLYLPTGPFHHQDSLLMEELKAFGIQSYAFLSHLLYPPEEGLKTDGTPYKVFTPFYKHVSQSTKIRKILPKPKVLHLFKDKDSLSLDDLGLISKEPFAKKIMSHWRVGEDAAQSQLKEFIANGLLGYKEKRNYPALPNVSRLSPYLHFGEISPHQVYEAISNEETSLKIKPDVQHFLSELGWREFSYHLLHYFPDLPSKNFQEKFNAFPWIEDPKLLTLWQKGLTGYPIVDAGMRELWETGYMHNRVRMIVGSFLVKNLLIHWHHGEAWFWDCLVDADIANNSASWQWIAGCGADAAPYFRIFNPLLQGEKFDPDGTYTRRFVPELASLPNKYLFKPFEAPADILAKANVVLGKTYPYPIVNLDQSRAEALSAYQKLKEPSS